MAIVAGCSSPSPPAAGASAASEAEVSAAKARGVHLGAELDRDTGAVILPYDRFLPTEVEQDTVVNAKAVLISRCAAERGVIYDPRLSSMDPVWDSETFFGPWTLAQAERFGFVGPMNDLSLIANGVMEGEMPEIEVREFTDEEDEILRQCGTGVSLDAALQGPSEGPWHQPLMAIWDVVLDDPESVAALADLSACYETVGLRADPERPGDPLGADYMTIDAEQIDMALRVVSCKDQVQFTERVAGVWAGMQAPIIVAYLDELTERRADLDVALVEARQILAEAGH